MFIGRVEMLEALESFIRFGAGVASLVGIGGAGKTTLIRKLLDEMIDTKALEGILVWSFYDDPDTNAFLQTAVEYFTKDSTVQAQGTGWFHVLKHALESTGPNLLILDGLERVQRPVTDGSGIFGELEDPLLRGLLVRLASNPGRNKAIITSRFPISDIERWNGRGHTVFALDELDDDSALRLIRSHGVEGTDGEVLALANRCGKHALSTDLMGAATTRFFGGNPVTSIQALESAQIEGDDQSSVLRAVLRIFERGLSKPELDLMSRLCVFRFGVTLESLGKVFCEGKEEMSGSLTGLKSDELATWLNKLVDLHLVHREGDDRFSVHPAVRDHFYVIFRDASVVHQAIGAHLSTLTDRPGVGLPTTKEALDLLEEFIHHSLRSINVDQAREIYSYRMGGNSHLNVTLGEYARTFRILGAFPEMPDGTAMYFCLRAFGRFGEALAFRPRNRYIRVINGELTLLRDDADETTRRIARILQGERLPVPERAPDHPFPPAFLHLVQNQVEEAESAAIREAGISMHQDDIVRNQMCYAEALRRRQQNAAATNELDKASLWVMKSGSHEHLAMLFLFRARLEIEAKEYEHAKVTLEEGLQIAEDSEFRILEIDLRTEWSRWSLAIGRADKALEQANKAIELALDPTVKYVWGAIGAYTAQVAALGSLGLQNELCAALASLMELQKQVDLPEWRHTEQMLLQTRSA